MLEAWYDWTVHCLGIWRKEFSVMNCRSDLDDARTRYCVDSCSIIWRGRGGQYSEGKVAGMSTEVGALVGSSTPSATRNTTVNHAASCWLPRFVDRYLHN